LGALPKEVNALVKSLGKLSRSGRESS
jgi:hypothetical protein